MKLSTNIFAPHSSKIDWCEPNYVVSAYIAEFWNTISNFLFILLPPILMYLYKEYSRYVPHCKFASLVWILLFMIGVGSIYFHCTLSLFGQFLDEIGILWICCAVLAMWMLDHYLPTYWKLHRKQYQLTVLSSGLIVTLLSFIKPEINHFFLFLFAFPAFTTMYKETKKSNCPTFTQLGRNTLYMWSVALCCWFLDRLFCSFWLGVHFPYLHGFWHILVLMGGYQACVCYSYCYAMEQVAHEQPMLKFHSFVGQSEWFGVWYVVFNDSIV